MTGANVPQPGSETRWSADELIPFGKYILLHRMSSGATAAVYRAKIRGEAGFERIVAIKRILPHMAGDPEFVETFVREAKTSARLTHTNICPIYELGKVGESLYMAMECIPGRDLGKLRARIEPTDGTLPHVVSAWIATKLCDALDYAHNLKDARGQNAGVIHRDLSPANVVISFEGQVKLIDFGLAKASGRAQQTNVDALKHKLGYMSPEMVKGIPLDARSDVFGVGVLLYEMVTARRLFDAKDDIATLKLVGKASIPPPSAVAEDPPEELELIIMKALAKDPDDRYQSAADMGEALLRYVLTTDPMYGPRKLAEMMTKWFGEDSAEEQRRINELLEASGDAKIIEERKAFFMSAAGMVARARAEGKRDAIPNKDGIPKAPRVPSGGAKTSYPPLQDAPSVDGGGSGGSSLGGDPHSDETRVVDESSFTDVDEPTIFEGMDHAKVARALDAAAAEEDGSDAADGHTEALDDAIEGLADALEPDDDDDDDDESSGEVSALLDDVQAPMSLGDLDEEPTGFFDVDGSASAKSAVPAPPAPLGSSDFEGEATEFLDGEDLDGMRVEGAGPAATGDAQVVDANELIESVAPVATAGDAYGVEMAGFDEDATEIFFNTEDDDGNPEMLEEIRSGSVRPGPSTVHVVSSVPAPQAPPPAGAAPAPQPANALPQRASRKPGNTRRITAEMAAAQIQRTERMSMIMLTVGLLLLGLSVAGLIAKTRVGVALGLRRATVGSIEIRTNPPVPATVKLDEIFRGQTPIRMDGVPAGQHHVEVEATGYLKVTRDVQLEGGTTALLDVSMVPNPQ